jgi:hypothetical protein
MANAEFSVNGEEANTKSCSGKTVMLVRHVLWLENI